MNLTWNWFLDNPLCYYNC